MNIRRTAVTALTSLIVALPLTSFATPASDDDIRELLRVSQAQSMMVRMNAMLDSFMEKAVEDSLHGTHPTAKQQQAIDKMRQRVVGLMKQQLAWEKMEPLYLRVYRETFTAEDCVAMTAFYQTPAGQAMITKMPVMMQKLLGELQAMTASMGPEMKKIEADFKADMAAAK